MNNRLVAMDINIPARDLSDRCTTPRGNTLTWVLRQLLINEYNRLQPHHRSYLEGFLLDLVLDSPATAKAKSDGWLSGKLVFPDDYLQRLGLIIVDLSPFKEEEVVV